MRVIEEHMLRAIRHQQRMKRANTCVEPRENGKILTVRLHGNRIAEVDWFMRQVTFYSDGYLWHSRTTFSRQNAICAGLLGRGLFGSTRGTAYCGEREWDTHDVETFAIAPGR